MNALLVQMEDLILLHEKKIKAWNFFDYIQILKKHQKDDEKHLKKFEDGNLVLWLPMDLKIKKRKFFFLGLACFE
jgi:hypothetical protein